MSTTEKRIIEHTAPAEVSTDGLFLIVSCANEIHIPRTPETVRIVKKWLGIK